jgi:hypothetical protein
MTALLWVTAALAVEPKTRGLEVVAVAPAAPSSQVYRRRVALVVGINDYREPSLALGYAVADAESVAAVLDERFGFDEVITLYDAAADRQGVLDALSALSALEPDDAVLIFWAGHGATVPRADGGEDGYLLPWDGSRLDPDHPANLTMTELRTRIGRDIPARHKLLVVDACYSGLLAVRDAPALPAHSTAYLQAVLHKPAFQILTAGQADQTVLDEGPGENSVFTGELLLALEEADDFVTATELALIVQRRVQAAAFAQGGHDQRPDFGRVSGTGDFVLVPIASDLQLTPRVPLLGSRSRKLAGSGAALALVGIGGLGTAAATHASYTAGGLEEDGQQALYTVNRAAYFSGWGAVSASGVFLGAALITGEW